MAISGRVVGRSYRSGETPPAFASNQAATIAVITPRMGGWFATAYEENIEAIDRIAPPIPLPVDLLWSGWKSKLQQRRGGRVVECTRLESGRSRKASGSSNLPLSPRNLSSPVHQSSPG